MNSTGKIVYLTRVLPGRIAVSLVALFVLFGNTSTTSAQRVQIPASAAGGDFAGLVDIGGRSLYLECRGSGSPTVVLENGYRGSARYWIEDFIQRSAPRTMVLPAVERFSRVCAYDRPGTIATYPVDDSNDESLPAASSDEQYVPSRSDPVPQPRTVTDQVDDLHALLIAANVPGPYVMVGQSLGGLIVRLYTATYPDNVVGMVLVDPFPEQLETQMTPDQWQKLVKYNVGSGGDEVQTIPGYGPLETVPYASGFPTMRAAAAASPLRPMPLSVLSHGIPFEIDEQQLGFAPNIFEQASLRAYRELTTLVPDGRFYIATDSRHDIHQDQPAVVTEAIRDVVEGVRDPATWDTLRSCCGAS
jgi:pimeloyl-ACP methyl ester carboxylesterase